MKHDFINEILNFIFKFCDIKTLLNCSKVSKKYNELANSDMIWKEHVKQLFLNKFTYWILLKQEKERFSQKKLYFYSIRDSKRIVITKEELISMFCN
jgi:hypothetical protein